MYQGAIKRLSYCVTEVAHQGCLAVASGEGYGEGGKSDGKVMRK